MSESRSAAETIYPDLAQAPETPAAAETAPSETTAPETAASDETAAAPTLLTEKPTEEAAPAEPPPEPFDAEKITFPEGMAKDDKLFGEFSEKAKAHGLSHAAAQDFVDLYSSAARDIAQQNWDTWQKTQASWVAEVKADPEIGPNLDAIKKGVGKLLDDRSLGGPGARQVIDMTGAGNHKEFIRFMARIEKILSEGSHVQGNGPVLQRSDRSPGQIIYPHLPSGLERQ
jgi:hypothetical protein